MLYCMGPYKPPSPLFMAKNCFPMAQEPLASQGLLYTKAFQAQC
jgi:hypothetical protein